MDTSVASFMLAGFDNRDVVSLVSRELLGGFMLGYRFRYVYDPIQPIGERWFSCARQTKLRDRLATCPPYMPSLAPAVAYGEIAAGLGLIVGLGTIVAALGLVLILAAACCCTPREELQAYGPKDRLDAAVHVLHLAEPLYLWLALLIVAIGPGAYSLDYLIAPYLR